MHDPAKCEKEKERNRLSVFRRIPFRSIIVAFPPFCQSKDANMRTSISSLARTISAMSCLDTPSK